MKARTPSGPSTTQRENDVTSALTESGHERLRLPMELLWSWAVPISGRGCTKERFCNTSTPGRVFNGLRRAKRYCQIQVIGDTLLQRLGTLRL